MDPLKDFISLGVAGCREELVLGIVLVFEVPRNVVSVELIVENAGSGLTRKCSRFHSRTCLHLLACWTINYVHIHQL